MLDQGFIHFKLLGALSIHPQISSIRRVQEEINNPAQPIMDERRYIHAPFNSAKWNLAHGTDTEITCGSFGTHATLIGDDLLLAIASEASGTSGVAAECADHFG